MQNIPTLRHSREGGNDDGVFLFATSLNLQTIREDRLPPGSLGGSCCLFILLCCVVVSPSEFTSLTSGR